MPLGVIFHSPATDELICESLRQICGLHHAFQETQADTQQHPLKYGEHSQRRLLVYLPNWPLAGGGRWKVLVVDLRFAGSCQYFNDVQVPSPQRLLPVAGHSLPNDLPDLVFAGQR
jgi:hypothetical protein